MTEAPLLPLPGLRRRRDCTVRDVSGNEVLITYPCLKCHRIQPLKNFGLRRMGNGQIRSIPWCRTCRSPSKTRRPGV